MDPVLVALHLPPGLGMFNAVQQVWEGGGAALPLPWHAPRAVLDALVAELRPGAIAHPRPRGGIELKRRAHGHPVAPGTALVVATSGSTGRPKGVELGHSALTAMTRSSVERLGADRSGPWLCCLPLHHVAGIAVMLRAERVDADVVVHERFDVEAVRAERDARFVALVPTMLRRLLDAEVDLSGYRAVLVGGARVDDDLLARARTRGVPVVQSYGMTETSGGCVYDGTPLDGVEVDVAHDGRVLVRGRTLMSGYRGRPDLTAKVLRDGWFRTQDLGRLTADGRLEVLGRADDVIVTGGEKVVPAAVADALRATGTVRDAAVVGIPDPEWGQAVAAVVVPVPGQGPPSLDALRDALRDVLPAHALPRVVTVVEDLPRDAMGKVANAHLAALVEREAAPTT